MQVDLVTNGLELAGAKALRLDRFRGFGSGEVLAAFLPFVRVEEAGADFNQPGNHFEDGDAAPGTSIALAKALLVEIAHDG